MTQSSDEDLTNLILKLVLVMPHPLLLVSKFSFNLFVSDPVFTLFFKEAVVGTLAHIPRDQRPQITPQMKALKPVYHVTKFKSLASVVWNLYAIKLITDLEKRKKYPAPFDNFWRLATIWKCFLLVYSIS